MTDRLLVTLCTYNEYENIERLVPQIRELVPDADVLVVDDSSPDGTGQLVEKMAAADEKVIPLHRTERGLSGATLAAFQYAADHEYDVAVNLDADLSHPPERINGLISRLSVPSPVDVCVGSRYCLGGEIEGWPLRRHVMSRAVNLYTRLMLSLPVRDTSGSFRAYRGELLRRIDYTGFRSRGYAIQQEMLYRCQKAGAKFAELPITFVERTAGVSKIRMRDGWEVLKTLVLLRLLG